ncbi:MAG: M81 family metallopeptidase [Chloroflexi bacterium]|nr:M81 family metallopeptidase [Chloroflexota bacterium]
MRIAIGGISYEGSNFSPIPVGANDFVVRTGGDLLSCGRYPFLDDLARSVDAPVEFVPTLHARSGPGGPLERAAYEAFKRGFVKALAAAGPVDGLYLDLHGALFVEGMEDAELDWALAARRVVGNACLISASMDLHGNISPAFAQAVDMLTAYRTAPHADVIETRQRALALLIGCLERRERPTVAQVTVPVLLPGERSSTAAEPAAALYARLPGVDRRAGILDASLFMGFAWSDEPRTSAAVTVTGFDRAAQERAAAELAQALWDARTDFSYAVPFGTIDDCIHQALAAGVAPVFISDAGDNPTAGAVGDVPLFLERLLALDVPDAVLAAIPDREAVAVCMAAGEGSEVSLTVGGKLDRRHGPPLPVAGHVERLVMGDPETGSQAVVRVGGVRLILTERRKAFTELADFAAVGIDPRAHKIVVVKLGYLFPELARTAALALLALSPGVSDLELTRLPYRRVRRPIYPLDPQMEWQAMGK